MMECPCKGCMDRYVKTDSTGVHRCHSSCQKYANYRKELEKQDNRTAPRLWGHTLRRQDWSVPSCRPFKRTRQSIWLET